MLNHVYWAVEGRIIAHDLSGEVTLQDMKDLTEQMCLLIETDPHAAYVDIFLDVTRVSGYHRDILNIKKLFASVSKHDAVRWAIIINPNPNPVLHFVVRTVCQLLKKRVRIVPTVDAALDFIHTETAAQSV